MYEILQVGMGSIHKWTRTAPGSCPKQGSLFCNWKWIQKILGWDFLEIRRKATRATLFHQTLEGHLAIPMQKVLRPVQKSSRNNKYIQIGANKNCYKYSFIRRTLVEWKTLPPQITSIEDKAKFKLAVFKNIYSRTRTKPLQLLPPAWLAHFRGGEQHSIQIQTILINQIRVFIYPLQGCL